MDITFLDNRHWLMLRTYWRKMAKQANQMGHASVGHYYGKLATSYDKAIKRERKETRRRMSASERAMERERLLQHVERVLEGRAR